MAVTVVAAAGAARNNIGPGNLSSTQVLLRGSDLELLTLPDAFRGEVASGGHRRDHRGAPGCHGDTARSRTRSTRATRPSGSRRHTVGLARPSGDRGSEEIGAVFVATPSLLGAYRARASDLAGRDVVTGENRDAPAPVDRCAALG